MSAELRFREVLPEPRRLWVRACPVSWPGAEGEWIDLAGPGLGVAAGGAWTEPDGERLAQYDDLLYLPPVDGIHEAARRELAARCAALGVPVLLQGIVGTPGAAEPAVIDLTAALVVGRLEELATLPANSTAIWPWIAGLTDREEQWGPGLERLAAAGTGRVVAVSPELSPRERRRLAERASVEQYGDLFHRAARPLAPFWSAAIRRGIQPFAERPVPREPRSVAIRRRVAGELALAGDLLLVTGEEVEAQGLLLAARRLDGESLDLEALVREGNLGLLDWLDEAAAGVVRETLGGGRSGLVRGLLAKLSGGDPGPTETEAR